MKHRIIAAVVLAVALAVAASTAAGSTRKAAASEVVVWVMTDAQNGWPGAVAGANSAFKQQHPGVDVNIQYQSWDSLLQKFDAALAAGDTPDVIELGNTQTTKYMAAGALSAIKAGNYPNSKTWLGGLKASCSYNGKLYCVPYYAGARAVIYRKDQYAAVGVKKTPATYAQFVKVGKKLMKKTATNQSFSALYFPGKYWYAGMSFVYDFGGQIAKFENGKWKGALDSPQAIAGLTKFKSVVTALSRAEQERTTRRIDPSIQFMAQGPGRRRSSANGWEWGVVFDKKSGQPQARPRSWAPTRCRAASRASTCPRSWAAPTSAIPITSEEQAAWRSTGSSAFAGTASHEASSPTRARSSRTPPPSPSEQAATRSSRLSPGGQVQLVHPDGPNWASVERGQGAEEQCSRDPDQQGKSVQPRRQRRARKITKILNASRDPRAGKRDARRRSRSRPPAAEPPARIARSSGALSRAGSSSAVGAVRAASCRRWS